MSFRAGSELDSGQVEKSRIHLKKIPPLWLE